jgi:hypothetical protein
MGINGIRTKPMFEKTEHWSSPLSREEVFTAIAKAFVSERAKVLQDGDVIEVRTGSNWQYRLWGNLFSWSRGQVPVAVSFRVGVAEQGVHIDAHACDTFGIRITDHAFFGAQKTFEERLEFLLRKAAIATEAS